MELPGLGERCAFEDCKQLDFLPFECTFCKLTFCKDHYIPDNHDCTTYKRLPTNDAGPIKYYSCTYVSCSSLSSVEMCCIVCKKHFCLQHRHHGCIDKEQAAREKEKELWEAPKQQFQVAKAEADRQVEAGIIRAKKKNAHNKVALKVQLMRLKGKATGNKGIPADDRVYFMVHPPLTTSKKSKAVFVAKQWSVGRVTDSIADTCDIPNKNNEAVARKLRLFHHYNGQILSSEMEKNLNELLKNNEVVDGETLILEYVTEEKFSLEQETLEKYKN